MERNTGARSLFLGLVDRTMLGVYQVARFTTRVIPPRLLYPLVNLLAGCLYYSRRRVRRDLKSKIREAMPGVEDPRELDRIGRGAYASLLFAAPDFFYFKRHSDRFLERLEVEGAGVLERAEAEGRGVLIMTVHAGPPLKGFCLAQMGKPYTLVMWHPDTSPTPRYTTKMALEGWRIGCDREKPVIWVGDGYDTIGEVRGCLEQGRRVGLAVDVPGRHPVEFFGRPAALADGIAHWARRSGVPIVPISLTRTGDPYRMRLTFHDPIRPDGTAGTTDGVHALMREVAAAAERMILEAPEQWMSWFGLWHLWAEADEIMKGITSPGGMPGEPARSPGSPPA